MDIDEKGREVGLGCGALFLTLGLSSPLVIVAGAGLMTLASRWGWSEDSGIALGLIVSLSAWILAPALVDQWLKRRFRARHGGAAAAVPLSADEAWDGTMPEDPSSLAARLMALREVFDEGSGFQLLAGLSEEELNDRLAELPVPPPPEIRQAMAFSRGFEGGPMEDFDLLGSVEGTGVDEVFPEQHFFAADGCGNFWFIELDPEAGTWGPVWFGCHDPPVVACHGVDLADFIERLHDCGRSGSDATELCDDAAFTIWSKNPHVTTRAEALRSGDDELVRFAESLPEDREWDVCDMRELKPGQGFSWGRDRPDPELRRAGEQHLFAIERKGRR